MVNHDTVFIDACSNVTGTIYDNGGPTGNYTNSFEGWVVITSAAGSPITLNGNYVTESASYDWLDIWDGNPNTGTQIANRLGGTGSLSLTATSGRMTIKFRSDVSVVRSGFELQFSSCCNTPCHNAPSNLVATPLSPTSAQFTWTATNPSGPFLLSIGDNIITVNSDHYTATNLSAGTLYNISVSSMADNLHYCCSESVMMRTPCDESVAFEYDNLYASNVTCRYGSFSNPNQSVGVVDNGSASSSSRHTIHSTIGETDPRTAGHLQTIPNGYCSSVRLGNWSTGSQAESITYTYTVDTNDHDLLLLKYAAVLEDPSHSSSEQPRFTFDITDLSGNSVNSCYSANFISNPDLDWNYGTSNSILWKDWTTVGVDLSPLHGQTIRIILTTYDCSQSGHYGYAYFVIDCGNKTLRSSNCQGAENTFYAPSGFSYCWYNTLQPTTTLSTCDSLHVTTDGTYHCRLSFVGAPNDEAHQNCYFTLTATSGVRFPYARFSHSQLDTTTCDLAWVRLQNRSIQTRDSAHTDSIAANCETYLWIFDDGSTSTDINPRHGFTAGLHHATLYAMIADGSCVDSTQQSFMVVSPCLNTDTIAVTICDGESYSVFDTVLTTAGTYILDSTGTDGSQWIRTVLFSVNPNSYMTTAVTECDSLAWFDGITYTASGSYYYHLENQYDCDSLITLNLTLHQSYHTDTSAYACDSYTWHGNTFTASQPEYMLHNTSVDGCDSTVTLHLTIAYSSSSDTTVNTCDNFTWYGVYFDTSTNAGTTQYSTSHTNAAGCDSTATLNLTLRRSSIGDTTADECDSFTWYGVTYNQSTTEPTHLSNNAVGCDSTTTLHLTIRYSSSSMVNDTIVENQLPHTFNNVVFADSTNTIVTIPNAVQCDSAIAYSLFVHRNVDTVLFDTLCHNMLPHTWNGITHDTNLLNLNSLTYIDTVVLFNRHGADSSIFMYLTIHPLYDHHLYTGICDNNTIIWGTPQRTIAPQYAPTSFDAARDTLVVDSLLTVHGCDSVSSLHLTIHPTYNHHLYDTVCINQSYSWGTPQRVMLPVTTIEIQAAAGDTLQSYGFSQSSFSSPDTVFTDELTTTGHSPLVVGGCDSLSSLHLHLMPAYDLHFYDTICDRHVDHFDSDSSAVWTPHTYMFESGIYNTTGAYVYPFSTSLHSCDSVRTLHLKVHQTHDLHFHDTIYDGDSYTFEQSVYDTTGSFPHLLATTNTCDSIRTLHLQRNRRTYIDSVVCQNSLPMTWSHRRGNGPTDVVATIFTEGSGIRGNGWQVIRDSIHLTGADGIDSLLVMTLIVRDTSTTSDVVHCCDSFSWSHTPDTLYRESTASEAVILTQSTSFDTAGVGVLLPGSRLAPFTLHLSPYSLQCDSVRHLVLTVNNTHYHTETIIACDSLMWRDRIVYLRDTISAIGPVGSNLTIGPVDSLTTIAGCDSVIGLDLAIRYSTYEESVDSFCWHQSYTWRGQTVDPMMQDPDYPSSQHLQHYLTDTVLTHYFTHPSDPARSAACDSVLAIRLTQIARPLLQLVDSIDCENKQYTIHFATDVPWWWLSSNERQLTSGVGDSFPIINEYSLAVEPDEPYSTYTVRVDYREEPLCPLETAIRLRPIVVPDADFRYNPEALSYNNLTFDAWDLTPVHPRSIHPGEDEVWRRSWYTDEVMLGDTSGHLTHEVVLAELGGNRDSLRLALSIYNGQCSDTAVRMLPMLRVAVFAANAFTPTEETNNHFYIATQGVIEGELRIYNRDGLLVFSTNDPSTGWDGRDLNGRLCEQGNYVWKFIYRAIDHPEARVEEVGTVLLLR